MTFQTRNGFLWMPGNWSTEWDAYLRREKLKLKKELKKLKLKKVLHCLAISASIIGRTIRKINVFILVGKMLLIFRTSSDGRGQKEAHVRGVWQGCKQFRVQSLLDSGWCIVMWFPENFLCVISWNKEVMRPQGCVLRECDWGSLEFGGLPWWLSGKESFCQCKRHGFDPWAKKIPWRRKWQPTPVSLPGESHGQRSLVGYSPPGCKTVRHN